MDDKQFLTLQKLYFSYGEHRVVKDFSANIPCGLTILQGDESTGKSTLLKLIAGSLSPSSGSIEYPAQLQHVGSAVSSEQIFVVGDQAEDWEQKTPSAFFEYCRSMYRGMNTQRLNALIDAFGLREHVEKTLFMLSRGSKRKVWLTAAFSAGAPVTLIDDPFIALDVQSVRTLKTLLNESAQWTDRALITTQHVPDPDLTPTQLIDLNKVH